MAFDDTTAWERLEELESQVYAPSDRTSYPFLKAKYFPLGIESTLLAGSTGEWMGNVQLVPSADGRSVYLMSLSLFPGFQGRGHGNDLMAEVLKLARGRTVYSRVALDNPKCLSLHARFGFRPGALTRRTDDRAWQWFVRSFGSPCLISGAPLPRSFFIHPNRRAA
jgi:GNAT superfamily N-acetyltransferase